MSNDYLNSRIGRDYKQMLEEIADKQERSMTGQLRIMIDKAYEKMLKSDTEVNLSKQYEDLSAKDILEKRRSDDQ